MERELCSDEHRKLLAGIRASLFSLSSFSINRYLYESHARNIPLRNGVTAWIAAIGPTLETQKDS
jgi:hypothetical protein